MEKSKHIYLQVGGLLCGRRTVGGGRSRCVNGPNTNAN
nr:MAG TPA_asm: hypothetical protein [Caudoviricetes sp.]